MKKYIPFAFLSLCSYLLYKSVVKIGTAERISLKNLLALILVGILASFLISLHYKKKEYIYEGFFFILISTILFYLMLPLNCKYNLDWILVFAFSSAITFTLLFIGKETSFDFERALKILSFTFGMIGVTLKYANLKTLLFEKGTYLYNYSELFHCVPSALSGILIAECAAIWAMLTFFIEKSKDVL